MKIVFIVESIELHISITQKSHKIENLRPNKIALRTDSAQALGETKTLLRPFGIDSTKNS